MNTLYDLLGALPNDGAEGLRTAFRRAVKGAHPDIHPGDPDAALKFRQIVRANDILTDDEQRAAYDHLLKLAHLEQKEVSRHTVAAIRTRRLVSGVMALVGASLVAAGGFLLFTHVSAASIATADSADVGPRKPSETATIPVTEASFRPDKSAPAARDESAIPAAAIAPPAATHLSDAEGGAANAAPDTDASGDRFFQARGIYVGGPAGAMASLDLAVDHKLLPAYVDPGVIFYRAKKLRHAFGQSAPAKRVKAAGGSKSPSALASRPQVDRTATAPLVTPWSQTRIAAQDPSREGGGVASSGLR